MGNSVHLNDIFSVVAGATVAIVFLAMFSLPNRKSFWQAGDRLKAGTRPR